MNGRSNDRVLWIAVLILGWALRWHTVGTRSLWVDEAFSLWLARHPLPALLTWVARIDQHPPLYYLLLAGWIRVAGTSETALRGLSVLLSTFTLPLAYRLGTAVAGPRAGTLLLLLLALAPLQIRYAQEARMYALMTLAATSYLWAGVRALRSTTPETARRWLALSALAALLLVYTHHLGWLVVLPVGGYLAGWAWRRRYRRELAFAVGLLVLGWLPWAPVFFHQAAGVMRRFWIPFPTWRSVMEAIHAFLAGFTPVTTWTLAADALFLAAGGGAAWTLSRRLSRPGTALLLVLAAAGPIALALAVSAMRPVFQVRTLIPAGVPLLTLLAVAFARGRPRPWLWGLLGLWLALNAWGAARCLARPDPEPWRAVAAHVARRVRPGDVLLFHATWVQLPFDYYFKPYGIAVPEHGVPVDLFARGELEPLMRPEDVPRVWEHARNARRVWLIYSHDWYTDPQGWVLRALDACCRRMGEWRWPGVRVFLYVPRASATGPPSRQGERAAFTAPGARERR